MKFIWSSYEVFICSMKFIWTSYDCICSTYEVHMNFIWNSYRFSYETRKTASYEVHMKFHMKFICTPYALHMSAYAVHMQDCIWNMKIWSSYEDFIWNMHDCIWNLVKTSYAVWSLHMNFIWSDFAVKIWRYEVNMKTSYEICTIAYEIW